MSMTLFHALRLNARRHPQRTAIRFREDALSYAEMLARTERAMCALGALGLAPGEKVPMLSHNHADMLVAYFALTGIGAVPAPLNYRLADDDLRHGIGAAHARFVLLGSGFAALAQALADPAWRWIWFADAERQVPADALRWRTLLVGATGAVPQDRAANTVMLHTSGTTGRPKGALRSRFGFGERAIEQGFGADDIPAFAAARLAPCKKPRRAVFMAELPRNLTGRVLKTRLVEQVLGLPAANPERSA